MATLQSLKDYVKAHKPWDGYLDWTDLVIEYTRMHNVEFSLEDLAEAFHEYWTVDLPKIIDNDNDDMVVIAKRCSAKDKLKESYWLTMLIACYSNTKARKIATEKFSEGFLTKEDYEIFCS